MKDATEALLPLSPATLHILLALTSGDMHGYAIMQDVLRQSEGRYKLWPGTLYDNLQKLVRQALVDELGGKADAYGRRAAALLPFDSAWFSYACGGDLRLEGSDPRRESAVAKKHENEGCVMVEQIYRALLRFHPSAFRETFRRRNDVHIRSSVPLIGSGLITDSVFSLVRQWLLRADFRNPPQPATTSLAEAVRSRPLEEETGLRRRYWMASVSFLDSASAGASMLLGRGGNGDLAIGSRGSSNTGVRIQAKSADGHLDTEIAVRPEGLLDTFTGRALVNRFYRNTRVLPALASNHDLILSPGEIANAPAVLLSLDRNHDGILDEIECVRLGRRKQPFEEEDDPMRTNPALRALDGNHDGRLSAAEIRRAPASLKLLDRNHDGSLSPEELLSAEQIEFIRKALQRTQFVEPSSRWLC